MAVWSTSSGYTVETEEEWQTFIFGLWRAQYGTGVDLTAASPDGKLARVVANALSRLDAAAGDLWASLPPSGAQGSLLDAFLSILGMTRNAATYSTISAVTLTGTPATSVPAGTQFRNPATLDVFALNSTVVIGGSGTVSGAATCTVTGPVACVTGALTEIVTAVSGLASVTNAVDALQGTNEETDAEARSRRRSTLARAGRGTVDSIAAAIADLDGILASRVDENTSDTTNGDGVPPHAIHALVLGGTGQEIGDALWEQKPAGIYLHGSTSVNVTDAAGNTQTTRYTVPSTVNVYIYLELTTDDDYPDDGDDQIEAAVLAAFGAYGDIGEDVIAGLAVRAAYGVDGVVTQVVQVRSTSTTFPLSGDSGNLAINSTQVAAFAAARISVSSS